MRRFSMVFPRTELFISLKKSFSNEFLACFCFSVLKSIYCWIAQILSLNGLSLFSNRDQGIAEDFDNSTHALSCLLKLGLVYLLDQSKCYIFRQSFWRVFWVITIMHQSIPSASIPRATLEVLYIFSARVPGICTI